MMNDLSQEYKKSASLIRCRLIELRAKLKRESDPEKAWNLKRRIAELTPILTEMNELAELTERYYERGYYRSEKYSANGFYKIDRCKNRNNDYLFDSLDSVFD